LRAGPDPGYYSSVSQMTLIGSVLEENMRSEVPVVLAAYSSRSRVVREGGGRVRLYWGAMSLALGAGEFAEMAVMLGEAGCCGARRGEVACGACGRVERCAMGQVMVSHGDLTLWFAAGEFAEFARLVGEARERLADAAPLPALGMPWEPRGELFGSS
jgi:hypothetical protein